MAYLQLLLLILHYIIDAEETTKREIRTLMDKNVKNSPSLESSFMSTDQLSHCINSIKKRSQGGGAFQDAEDLVFVLSARLVIDSMS